VFDVYVRVSRLGDRTEEEATEISEAQVREWANRNDAEIDLVFEDTNVSGSTAVEERELEKAIKRVEAGESEGILTPYLDRFGRDLIHGALAYRRIKVAGGRLVCTQDGLDSDQAGNELVFNLRMSIAQEYLDRNRANFLANVNHAAARGVYLASRAPFGYRRRDQVEPTYKPDGTLVRDGTLVIHPLESELVKEAFRRRAEGANWGVLSRWLTEASGRRVTKSGARSLIQRRVYVGEMRVQTSQKGEPRVVTGVVPQLVSEADWQAAQGSETAFIPRSGVLSKQAQLSGLVYCATCGSRCKINGYGKPEARQALYLCTSSTCSRHGAMKAERLDTYAARLLGQAFEAGEPHVIEIRQGSNRYEALNAVERAQANLAEYRDDVEMQMELGRDAFLAGLRARKADVEAKRAIMRAIPRPSALDIDDSTWDTLLATGFKAVAKRYIKKVIISPANGRMKRSDIPARVQIIWHGQEG
jgi:DNA invertase Pin-like site-specific DNA recombinase